MRKIMPWTFLILMLITFCSPEKFYNAPIRRGDMFMLAFITMLQIWISKKKD
jgi:hypothetical protein